MKPGEMRGGDTLSERRFVLLSLFLRPNGLPEVTAAPSLRPCARVCDRDYGHEEAGPESSHKHTHTHRSSEGEMNAAAERGEREAAGEEGVDWR